MARAGGFLGRAGIDAYAESMQVERLAPVMTVEPFYVGLNDRTPAAEHYPEQMRSRRHKIVMSGAHTAQISWISSGRHVTEKVLAIALLAPIGMSCAPSSPVPAGAGSGSTEAEDDTTGSTDTGADDTEADDTEDTGVEPYCGNGIVEPEEECDDGEESAVCNADCTLAECGDSLLNAAAGEECDTGSQTARCDDDCTSVSCGDGLANAMAGEECDGSDLAGTTCRSLGFDGGVLSCDGRCSYDPRGCGYAPDAPALELSFSPIKQFDFTWAPVVGASDYQLEQRQDPGEPFVPLSEGLLGESISHTMPLHLRFEASYRLLACNRAACAESAVVDVHSSLAEAVGYFKASNTDSGDEFGRSVALSSDGNTLAVGAPYERSNATGIDGDQADDTVSGAGAVYLYARDAMTGQWSQHAYVKASVSDGFDSFGISVALSADGSTLAVGAHTEDSNATGIDGDPLNNGMPLSGAVHVYTQDAMTGQWSQQAYVKASNTGLGDYFGWSVALSADGDTLAVGAFGEASSATGIDGSQASDAALDAGAVYVYSRDAVEQQWSQQAYVKASNTESEDFFGWSVALSGDGNTLAVGAYRESSDATGIDGDQNNNASFQSGATYIYTRDGMEQWSQQAYIKASNNDVFHSFGRSIALSTDGDTLAVGVPGEDGAEGAAYVFTRDAMTQQWSQQTHVEASNPDSNDWLGWSVALSGDGNALAAGAFQEHSSAIGIDGDPINNSAQYAGAAYVFVRDAMTRQWSQQTYVKASNTGSGDQFGRSVALDEDGSTLAVGAPHEQSSAIGIDGDQADNSTDSAGAVYLY